MRKELQFMILKPSGNGGCLPDPIDWIPEKNSRVVILNDSGADQELTDIAPKLLRDNHNTWEGTIHIRDGEFWEGKTGAARKDAGLYTFDDGEPEPEPEPEVRPRTGTIDPS